VESRHRILRLHDADAATKKTKSGEVRVVVQAISKLNYGEALVHRSSGRAEGIAFGIQTRTEWQFYISGKDNERRGHSNKARQMTFNRRRWIRPEDLFCITVDNNRRHRSRVPGDVRKGQSFQDLSLSEWLLYTPAKRSWAHLRI